MQAAPPSPPGTEPDLADKVRFLSDPRSYRHAPETVEIRETHMSMVFLAGSLVYKLKKPVSYAVLDFSTVELRHEAVEEEVLLNRRLSPEVYLSALALRLDDGRLSLGPRGRIVDWLVEMRRLPDSETLSARLAAGTVAREDIRRVVDRLAEFYRPLPPAALTAEDYLARYETEHRKTAEVLSDPQLGFDGARVGSALTDFEKALESVRPLLARRIREGRVVEGHGDLRPEHVFLCEHPLIIDCLEFSLDLRSVDPFDEITFLGFECAQAGADWVFPALRQDLSNALSDDPPAPVLAFYWRYRALLRARLALLHLYEPVVRTPWKWRPLAASCLDLAAEADARVATWQGGA
ncbi:hypothetical protein [Ostreiculturibacter nitratireducens]|uniref:hypothetical protein n=1 Tax=Ostreiculturibacter nitratireducens TaxID=3075226 RepID=UPI0031B57775